MKKAAVLLFAVLCASAMAQYTNGPGGAGGGAPTGAAGGQLAGTYPNPTLAPLSGAQLTALFANATNCGTANYVVTPASGGCSAPGTGTVTAVTVTTANGVSATVANQGTTPAFTFSLGAIAPSTVNALTFLANSTGFSISGGTTSKTFTLNNSITFAGTDATTMTFPATSDTIPGLAQTNVFTKQQTAPAFFPQSLSAGPYTNYFDDFLTNAGISSGSALAGGTGSCAASTTFLDNTSPGNISVIGTTAGTGNEGWGCITAGGIYQLFDPATAPAWQYETRVIIPVLPGTTGAAYQAGLTHTYLASPWTTGIGFSLSAANGTANDWYCRYSSTSTDSTVAAVASTWTRLTIVDNGTNVLWYINGTQVCSVAVGSMPTNALYMGFTAVPVGTSTSSTMGVDYIAFQMQPSR